MHHDSARLVTCHDLWHGRVHYALAWIAMQLSGDLRNHAPHHRVVDTIGDHPQALSSLADLLVARKARGELAATRKDLEAVVEAEYPVVARIRSDQSRIHDMETGGLDGKGGAAA